MVALKEMSPGLCDWKGGSKMISESCNSTCRARAKVAEIQGPVCYEITA